MKPGSQIPLPYYKTRHVASGLNGSFITLDLSLSEYGSMEPLVNTVINLLVEQEEENSSTSRAFRKLLKKGLYRIQLVSLELYLLRRGMGDQISKDTEKCSIALTTKGTEINSKISIYILELRLVVCVLIFEPFCVTLR